MATFNARFTESQQMHAQFTQAGNMDAGFGEVVRVATSDYNELANKPKINTVEVIGEKTGAEYNLQNKLTAGDGISLEGDTISADLEYATYSEVMNYLNS